MSEMVDAMRMALTKRKYDKPPIALCPDPNCGAPLIGTTVFSGAEFYCLDCGGLWSFVAPKEGDPDDAGLNERLERHEAEWKANVLTNPRGELAAGSIEWLKGRKRGD